MSGCDCGPQASVGFTTWLVRCTVKLSGSEFIKFFTGRSVMIPILVRIEIKYLAPSIYTIFFLLLFLGQTFILVVKFCQDFQARHVK